MTRKKPFKITALSGIRLLCFSLLLLIGVGAQAQEKIKITGTIKDELNLPLPGVSITNLKSGRVTSAASTGKFEIEASRGDTLVVRYVGYRDYTTVIKNIIDLNITLIAAENSLNEVAVVGYGQQKKISVVGAQSTVNMEDIKQPVANLSAALAGRISGLVGVQRSGLPGANGADLWIRGIATFNGSNNASPLVVVDGVQGRDINSFDAEDIASFTILKDAAATAVYGVAGANGVIVIQTKKGVPGKPNLMVNYTQGITSFTKRPELMDGVGYMLLRNEARVASGLAKEYSNNYINSTIKNEDPYLYPNVNWMDALFANTSQNRKANFSARGGSENATYYISGAYYDEQSLLRTDALQSYDAGTDFKRYNFTSNVSMNWTSSTKFELGIQGYITSTNYPGVNPQDAFADVMQTNPVLYPTLYPGGIVPGVSSAGAQPNPYAEITQTGYQSIFSNQVMSNARITQDLKFWVPGLSATALYSFDILNKNTIYRVRNRSTYLINKGNPYNDDGTINLNLLSQGSDDLAYASTNEGQRQFYTEASLNYDHDFGKKNHLTALMLYNQRSVVKPFSTTLTNSLPYRSQGIAGRATYSYAERYFGEVNFGYNGSENFAPGHRYGFFPAFGVGWVLSNEKFFEPIAKTLNFVKLRYSNGKVGDGGNTDTSIGGRRFNYLTLVDTGAPGYTFGNGSSNTSYGGTAISSYGTNATWAESHKQDLGLEIQAFKSVVNLTVDLFKERRSGVFLQRQSLPAIVGLSSSPWGNYGVMDNKGVDATLEFNPTHLSENMTLSLRGTFTYNRDKVIENDQPVQPFPYMERRGVNYLSTFGYVAEGLFANQAEIDNSASQSTFGTVRPGDIKYKDLNGDGKIDQNDITRIGNGDVPTTTYGIGFNLTYKNFYFGAFFQGVTGADRLLAGDGIIPFNNSTGPERSNLFAIAEDRWTVDNPNPNAFYPRLAYGNSANTNNAQISSFWVKDISFIRLKTLDLGYNLPKEFVKRMLMKNARFYIQGVNLWYWSPFKLWDPELNTANGTKYPNVRTATIGFQANF